MKISTKKTVETHSQFQVIFTPNKYWWGYANISASIGQSDTYPFDIAMIPVSVFPVPNAAEIINACNLTDIWVLLPHSLNLVNCITFDDPIDEDPLSYYLAQVCAPYAVSITHSNASANSEWIHNALRLWGLRDEVKEALTDLNVWFNRTMFIGSLDTFLQANLSVTIRTLGRLNAAIPDLESFPVVNMSIPVTVYRDNLKPSASVLDGVKVVNKSETLILSGILLQDWDNDGSANITFKAQVVNGGELVFGGVSGESISYTDSLVSIQKKLNDGELKFLSDASGRAAVQVSIHDDGNIGGCAAVVDSSFNRYSLKVYPGYEGVGISVEGVYESVICEPVKSLSSEASVSIFVE